MYANDFPKGLVRHRRVRHDLSQLVSLRDYCDSHHLSRSGALYRIHRRQVIAYKLSGRWWVLPPDSASHS